MNNNIIHDALRPILLETRFSGKTDQECFDALNEKKIIEKQDIVTRNIQGYLMLFRKWIPLKESTEKTAVRAYEIINGLDTLTMTESEINSEVTTVLTALADDDLVAFFINKDKLAILEMSNKYISEFDQMKLYGVRVGHVVVARRS